MVTKTLADESSVHSKCGDGGSIIVTSLLQMAALAKVPRVQNASSSERVEDVRSGRGGGSRCSVSSNDSGGRSRRGEMPSEKNVRVLLSDESEYKVLQNEMERSGFVTNVGLQHVVVDFINRRTKEKRKARLEARAGAMDDNKLQAPLSSFLGFLYADSRGGKGLSKELLFDKLPADSCSVGSSSLSSSKIPSSLRWDTAVAFFDPSSLLKDKDIRRQSYGASASSRARRRISRLGEEAVLVDSTGKEVADSTFLSDGRRDAECLNQRLQSPPLAVDASGRHSCCSPNGSARTWLEEEDTKRSGRKESLDKTVDSEMEGEGEDEDDTETWLAWPVLISEDGDEDVGDATSDTANADKKDDGDCKKQMTRSSKKMRWPDRLTCVDEIIDMPRDKQQRWQQGGLSSSSSSNSGGSSCQEKARQEPNEKLYNILREVSHLEAKSEALSRKTS